MIIKKIEMVDMEAFYKMQSELDSETKFMMYEPGERPIGEEHFKGMLEWFDRSGSCMLVAMDNDIMIGVIAAERGEMIRIRHTAHISLGILAEYRHQGIGTAFFNEIENWAKDNQIIRFELTVMCHNINAIKLYEKSGFIVEGKRIKSMKIDNTYIDEYYMAKII